jgi:hypothetical protein
VNSRAGYRAVEAAGAVDAQTDARPQAPWTPANGRRRPQLPQPTPAVFNTNDNPSTKPGQVQSATCAALERMPTKTWSALAIA